MTPIDKARQLVIDMYGCEDYYLAKKSAIICVNEILDLDSGDSVNKEYWEEVKSEIEKL